MSCAGKTTFAKSLRSHKYYCFDAMFDWHLIETLGLSIQANLEHIQNICIDERFVLDGWHLADKNGFYLPKDASVCVIWSSYEHIISQYRIAVDDKEQHRHMYNKWYREIDYSKFSNIRFFHNTGEFKEMTYSSFISSI